MASIGLISVPCFILTHGVVWAEFGTPEYLYYYKRTLHSIIGINSFFWATNCGLEYLKFSQRTDRVRTVERTMPLILYSGLWAVSGVIVVSMSPLSYWGIPPMIMIQV